MLQVNYTTLREIQRNPKRVSEEVNTEGKSFIVMSNNRPQFAIVSLKLLSQLQTSGMQDSSAALIRLLEWADQQDFNLPPDLSDRHDAYLWEKPEKLEK